MKYTKNHSEHTNRCALRGYSKAKSISEIWMKNQHSLQTHFAAGWLAGTEIMYGNEQIVQTGGTKEIIDVNKDLKLTGGITYLFHISLSLYLGW